MKRNAENYAKRVLRMIRVDGRTTRQIMDDVETLVNRDMPDDIDARAINDELDRLISRQFEMARRNAPVKMMYRIADDMFVLERALVSVLMLAVRSAG